MEAAEAFRLIRQRSPVPLVSDIHFDYKIALAAAAAGADCLRINPGNIGRDDKVRAVVDCAKDHGIPIRIGVNAGSLEKELQRKYGERLQSLLNDPFDTEFKLYLHTQGINVDSNVFEIKFNPPQNFASYRQAEMDTARVNTFNTMVAVPFMSKRFALKRFLGMTTEEVAENERLWKEENVDEDQYLSASSELRGEGITANNIAGDMSSLSSTAPPPPPAGGEGQPADSAGAPESTPPAPPA
jgi:hypothetical protein